MIHRLSHQSSEHLETLGHEEIVAMLNISAKNTKSFIEGNRKTDLLKRNTRNQGGFEYSLDKGNSPNGMIFSSYSKQAKFECIINENTGKPDYKLIGDCGYTMTLPGHGGKWSLEDYGNLLTTSLNRYNARHYLAYDAFTKDSHLTKIYKENPEYAIAYEDHRFGTIGGTHKALVIIALNSNGEKIKGSEILISPLIIDENDEAAQRILNSTKTYLEDGLQEVVDGALKSIDAL